MKPASPNLRRSTGIDTRKVVLDTETTGSGKDDRVIEVCLVEMVGLEITGRQMLQRFDPEGQPIHWGAHRVHGISAADLRGMPTFREFVGEIVEFIAGDRLYAHNAPYDARMMEAEFSRCAGLHAPARRYIDTVKLAKIAWPGEKCGMDALIARHLPERKRGKHGALEDALLLAQMMPLFVPASCSDVDRLLSGRRDRNASRDAYARRSTAGRPPAPPSAAPVLVPEYGTGMKAGVAEAMAEVETVEQACGLRTFGSDGWSKIGQAQLVAVLAPLMDVDALLKSASDLDEQHVAAALRWVCRGLPGNLAVARERHFCERKAARQLEERDAPEP